MSTMRPIRAIATTLLIASLAVAGCGRSQPDQPTTPAGPPPPGLYLLAKTGAVLATIHSDPQAIGRDANRRVPPAR